MSNQEIISQMKSNLLETPDVLRGAAFLAKARLRGFPRRFEAQQDLAIAQKLKPSIMAAMDYYEQELQPPTGTQIAVWVELLQMKGFQKPLPVDDDGNVLEDVVDALNNEWIEDLQEFPADLVELACRRWRRKNINRPPYASGELMESIKPEFIRRKHIYKNAEAILKLI